MTQPIDIHRNTVAIIGAGKVGTIFARQLSKKNYSLSAIISQSLNSAQETAQMCNASIASNSLDDIPASTEIYLITTPDNAIPEIANELISLLKNWRNRMVIHTSGALTRSVFESFGQSGARTVTLHPMQTFSSKDIVLSTITPYIFGVECDEDFRTNILKLVKNLGGRDAVFLSSDQKILYHLAGTIASNFFVTLVATAYDILETIGFDARQMQQAILPIMKGTFNNLKNLRTAEALTGPVQRGDVNTIESHLNELIKTHPALLPFYIEMSVQTAKLAKLRRDANEEKIEQVREILIQTLQKYKDT